MTHRQQFYDTCSRHQVLFAPIVEFSSESDYYYPLDFTARNTELTDEQIDHPDLMHSYVQAKLRTSGARYGIGGYNEHRTIYSRSRHFDTDEEPRRLHLGTDIWAEAGTPIYAPLAGNIHSFNNNDRFGDYGATIILHHDLDGVRFHTLYGHLSVISLERLAKKSSSSPEGSQIQAGEQIATLGEPHENGFWAPHLHIQIILDMEGFEGDYPGVCRFSERERWLANCPDPDAILLMNRFIR